MTNTTITLNTSLTKANVTEGQDAVAAFTFSNPLSTAVTLQAARSLEGATTADVGNFQFSTNGGLTWTDVASNGNISLAANTGSLQLRSTTKTDSLTENGEAVRFTLKHSASQPGLSDFWYLDSGSIGIKDPAGPVVTPTAITLNTSLTKANVTEGQDAVAAFTFSNPLSTAVTLQAARSLEGATTADVGNFQFSTNGGLTWTDVASNGNISLAANTGSLQLRSTTKTDSLTENGEAVRFTLKHSASQPGLSDFWYLDSGSIGIKDPVGPVVTPTAITLNTSLTKANVTEGQDAVAAFSFSNPLSTAVTLQAARSLEGATTADVGNFQFSTNGGLTWTDVASNGNISLAANTGSLQLRSTTKTDSLTENGEAVRFTLKHSASQPGLSDFWYLDSGSIGIKDPAGPVVTPTAITLNTSLTKANVTEGQDAVAAFSFSNPLSTAVTLQAARSLEGATTADVGNFQFSTNGGLTWTDVASNGNISLAANTGSLQLRSTTKTDSLTENGEAVRFTLKHSASQPGLSDFWYLDSGSIGIKDPAGPVVTPTAITLNTSLTKANVTEGQDAVAAFTFSNPLSTAVTLQAARSLEGATTADVGNFQFSTNGGLTWTDVASNGNISLAANTGSLQLRSTTKTDSLTENGEAVRFTLKHSASQPGLSDFWYLDSGSIGIKDPAGPVVTPTAITLNTSLTKANVTEGQDAVAAFTFSNPLSTAVTLQAARSLEGATTADVGNFQFSTNGGLTWTDVASNGNISLAANTGSLQLRSTTKTDSLTENGEAVRFTLKHSASQPGLSDFWYLDSGSIGIKDPAGPVVTPTAITLNTSLTKANVTEGQDAVAAFTFSNPLSTAVTLQAARSLEGATTADVGNFQFSTNGGLTWTDVASNGNISLAANTGSLQLRSTTKTDSLTENGEAVRFTLKHSASQPGLSDFWYLDSGSIGIKDPAGPVVTPTAITLNTSLTKANVTEGQDAVAAFTFSNPLSTAVTLQAARSLEGATTADVGNFQFSTNGGLTWTDVASNGNISLAANTGSLQLRSTTKTDSLTENGEAVRFTLKHSASQPGLSDFWYLDSGSIGIKDPAGPVVTPTAITLNTSLTKANVTEGQDAVAAFTFSNPLSTAVTLQAARSLEGATTADVGNFQFSTNGGLTWTDVASNGNISLAANTGSLQLRSTTKTDSLTENGEAVRFTLKHSASQPGLSDFWYLDSGSIGIKDPAGPVVTPTAITLNTSLTKANVTEGQDAVAAFSFSNPLSTAVTLQAARSLEGATTADVGNFQFSTNGGLTWIDVASNGNISLAANTGSLQLRSTTKTDSLTENGEAVRFTLKHSASQPGLSDFWYLDSGSIGIKDPVTVSNGAAFLIAGQLTFDSNVPYGDSDSDAQAGFAIELTGITTLSAADFLL